MRLDQKQKIRVNHTMLAEAGGVLLSLALFYAYFSDHLFIDLTTLIGATSVFWVVNISFLVALISGFNLRFSDASLSLPQMYWAGTTTIIALCVSRDLDTLFYLLLLVISVFGIFRVRVEQFKVFCVYVVSVLLLAILLRRYYFLPDINLFNELILWIAFSLCAAILTSICSSIVLLRNRLREKNHQLEQALQTKSRFLANMSHEIRTPMNGVLGMLELCLMQELQPKLHRQLSIARESANNLLEIINDILDISKLEAGHINLEPSEIDLPQLLENTLSSLQVSWKVKNLHCSVYYANNVPKYIFTDQLRLRQILTNLISNAIKFTEKGGIAIHVSAEPLAESEYYTLTFSVTDTGIGIDPQHLERLFDSFTQADASTTRKFGGTGLGLAIVKELCELMKGGVRAVSEPGKGSEFSFWIRVKKSEKPALVPVLKTLHKHAFSDKRLLVVEDNSTNQEVILMALEGMGIEADLADHGADAIDLLQRAVVRKTHYDGILMDCQMPVMDGYETTKIIREDKRLETYSTIPIIAMTANAMPGDREKCLHAGMNDYLCKPIDFSVLEATLVEWLTDKTPRTNLHNLTVEKQNTAPLDDTPKTPSTWDEKALLRAVGGKPERVKKITQKFIASLPQLKDELTEAYSKRDLDALKLSAHSLKGSAANLHVNQVSRTAASIEESVKKEKWEPMAEQLSQLEEDVSNAIEHINGRLLDL